MDGRGQKCGHRERNREKECPRKVCVCVLLAYAGKWGNGGWRWKEWPFGVRNVGNGAAGGKEEEGNKRVAAAAAKMDEFSFFSTLPRRLLASQPVNGRTSRTDRRRRGCQAAAAAGQMNK